MSRRVQLSAQDLPADDRPASPVRGGHAALPLVGSVVASIFLAGAVWAVYGRTLHAPFIYDDDASVVQNTSIKSLWPLWGDDIHRGPLHPDRHAPTDGRPLVNYTFALNYYFGELDPAGYRVVNILVHILSSILLMLIVRRTLQLEFFDGRFATTAGPLAFAAALLWALHPLQTETVVYVTQRTELLVSLFYLATLYAALRYWAAGTRSGHMVWLAVAFTACLMGMASKEVMVTAPVAILLFDRTFRSGTFRRAIAESAPLYLGMVWSWALLLALNASGPRSASAGFNLGVSATDWWFTQARFLWMYLKLAVWPWPLSIHYEVPYLTTLAAAWPWILATMMLVAGVLWLAWRRSSLGFAGMWVLLILLPTCVVPVTTEMAAERRMYLPLAALVTLFVAGGYTLIECAFPANGREPRVALGVTIVVTLLFASIAGTVSDARLTVYRDESLLWQDVLEKNPNDATALYDLGVFAAVRNDLTSAVDYFERALRIRPDFAKAHYNLGNALAQLDRRQEAIDHYEQALKLRPGFSEAANNLAIVLAKTDDSVPAIMHLEEVIRQNPEDADAHNNLGTLIMRGGDASGAIEQFLRAIALRPGFAEAESNLTNALVVAGRGAEAVPHGREAVKLQPDSAEAHNNLGAALYQLGDIQQAADEFEAAVRLKPNFVPAYGNLMVAYANLGRRADAIDAAEQGMQVAKSSGQSDMAGRIGAWLKEFRDQRATDSNSDQSSNPAH